MTTKTSKPHVLLTQTKNNQDILYCTHCGDITLTNQNHPFPQILAVFSDYYETHKQCFVTLTEEQIIVMAQNLTIAQYGHALVTAPTNGETA